MKIANCATIGLLVAAIGIAGTMLGINRDNAAIQAERDAPLDPKLLSVAKPPCGNDQAGQQAKPPNVTKAEAAAVYAKPQVKPALPVVAEVKPALPKPLWMTIHEANKDPRPKLLHFTDSQTCPPCKIATAILAKPENAKALASFACVEIDRAKDPTLFAWYQNNVGIGTIPCDMFYGKHGWQKFNGLPANATFGYGARLKMAFDYVTTPPSQRVVHPQDPPRLKLNSRTL